VKHWGDDIGGGGGGNNRGACIQASDEMLLSLVEARCAIPGSTVFNFFLFYVIFSIPPKLQQLTMPASVVFV
jgi:hypothetical protein